MKPPVRILLVVALGVCVLIIGREVIGQRYIRPVVWPEPAVITPGEKKDR